MRSWMAWRSVSPLTPPITCSICMRWNEAEAVRAAIAAQRMALRHAKRIATDRTCTNMVADDGITP